MINMLALIPVLFLPMIQLSCNNDDVKFINEGDNLPIRVAAEFKFDEGSGIATSETVSGANYDIKGSGINRMPGVEGSALFFDGLSNEVRGSLAFQGQIEDGEGRFWEVPILYEFPNGKEMLLVQKITDSSTPARTFYWIGIRKWNV